MRQDLSQIKFQDLDAESKSWKFKHSMFLLYRPDLLSEVRKPGKTDAPDQKEYEELKASVLALKNELCTLTKVFQALVSTISALAGVSQPCLKRMISSETQLQSNKRPCVGITRASTVKDIATHSHRSNK